MSGEKSAILLPCLTVYMHTDMLNVELQVDKCISSRKWDPSNDAYHSQSTIVLYTEMYTQCDE